MVDATSRDVMQRLIARGWSPVHAAALAGHGITESNWDPNALNPDEGAFGALQWRLDRRDNLNRFAAARGAKPNDLDTQLDFIRHEMMGPESKAGSAFMAAQDLPSAHAALRKYIRYANPTDAARLANAQRLLGVGGAAAPTGAPGAAAPFSLAPEETPQQAVGAMPLLELAKKVIAQNTQDDGEPMMEIAMARPLGLQRARELLAAMKRIPV